MKNKHIRGIIIDIITIALCITAIFVGVFSVKNANLNISGEIGFEKHEPATEAYLSSDWAIKISTDLGVNLTFTKGVSFLSEINPDDLSSFDKDTDGTTVKSVNVKSSENEGGDIFAYYNSTSKKIVIYSACKIYAPANCNDFFQSFKFDDEDLGTVNMIENLDFSNFDTSNVTDMASMFKGFPLLKKLDLSKFNTSKVTSMSAMFYRDFNLTEIDISNFDTSNVSDMSYMFYGIKITKLDLSNLKAQKVTDMKYMFYNCVNLTDLDLSGIETGQLSDDGLSYMFYGCTKLVNLNLRNTYLKCSKMVSFSNCTSLVSIDLNNFNTASATDMSGMFQGCSSLTSLDLSGFNTAKVTTMNYMFYNCTSLSSLDLSNFDTSNVTNMSGMFSGCTKLGNLNLSSFNTASVTDMSYMFKGCSTLTSLDLSSFDMSNITHVEYMFNGCSNLTTIYASDLWSGWEIIYTNKPFDGCTALKGAVAYDGSKVEWNMANYTTGYLTYKAYSAS